MAQKIIFHVDVNSAFLSWEAVYRLQHLGGTLDLRKIPSAVGGDMSKRHGIILAKSIPAKAYGIKTGEPVVDAVKKCPDLVLVPPNFELYEKSSKAFLEILRRYSPEVEQYSIDEAFMDMTGMEKLFGAPVSAATALKDEIYERLGFTVNVGISENRLLAKMASDFTKPNRVHTLFFSEIQQKMWPLPVRDLFFVGPASEKKLKNLGIYTIGQLATCDVQVLRSIMKKQGEVLHSFANGQDVSLIESEPPANKGYGNSTTIAFDVTDADTAKMVLLSLAETVARRLRKDHVEIQVISVGIRYFDLIYASHQRVLDQPTSITGEIHRVAGELFDELWNGVPIRHLGIHTSRVQEQGQPRQLSLFDDTDYEKLQELDQAIDQIRNKFGTDAVMRATFLQKKEIDHASGGISREKRTVDYSKEELL